jgi:hypothetical protein
MLYTDDDFVNTADLVSIDSDITDIVTAESLVAEGNNSLVRRGLEDAGRAIERHLYLGDLSMRDLAVRDTLVYPGLSISRAFGSLAQVVISGESENHWSVIKRYAVAKVLVCLYRAAMAKGNNEDRYTNKLEMVKEDIRCSYWPDMKKIGIPFVFTPLPAPGAIMMRCGTFGDANGSVVAGAGTRADIIQLVVTWVGDKYISGSNKNNGESYRSEYCNIQMANGKVAKVSIIGLTAPDGTQQTWTKAEARYSVAKAVGWNVWAGLPNAGVMYRQTLTPVALGTTTYTLAADPVLSGETLDLGQFPDINIEIKNELVRG